MKCSKCDTDNPADSKYCKECATSISGDVSDQPSFTKTLETPSKGIFPGTTFAARYKVIEELGRGGMGVVYKAEDTKLKRTVAIKVLPPELTGDEEAKARFIREAQSAAVLDHPNICTIYEVDESEDKTFISMAYVDGQNLRERVKAGPLEINEGLDLGIQAAEGLTAAHDKGIVHRDIKSANIMVTKQGQAKIMDFGLAKFAGASMITREGVTMGTVAYMSPEQTQGKAVDHRSDIWSLGVVLYEMFAGRLPFIGDREASILYSVVHEEPRPLKTIKPDIPVELQQIINRALKKKPESRYSSASELLKDMKNYQESLRASEAGVFNLRSFLSFIRKPRIVVSAVAVIVVICLTVAWFFNRQAKIRWAQEVAIPEITRLLGQDSYVEAFSLTKEVETYLKDDENLKELMAQMVQYISIGTSPNGADIFLKPFSEGDVEEEYLGQSPLEKVRFPFGPFWLRIEKEGYETYQTFYYGPDTYAFPDAIRKFEFTLDEKDNIPVDMVRIPETMAIMNLIGVSRENIQLFPYYIDKYEVSNREFKRFIDNGGYQNPEYWEHEFIKDGHVITLNEALAEFRDRTDRVGPSTWEAGTYPEGRDDFPVSGVSWYEAAAFAKFAGKTLPSISHWVGATDTDMSTFIIPFSNFSNSGPRQVGSGPVGPQGTYDMAGNVKEWCWNASGNLRFILGGGWNEPSYMYYEGDAQSPFTRLETYGFRCAQYVESNEEFLKERTRSIQLPAQKI
ncbi:MAG: protein kinase, partial [Acidobacteria bacterium]|nr:protein kinase [Acidobacteriota bacterium]